MVKKYLELLKNIYHDPKSPAGYGSIINLYKVAKKIEPKIKLEDVKFFLEGDRTYTLHRPRRIRFKRAKTIPSGLYTDIQCDLAQFEKFFRANRGYKYVLIAVCVLSKRIWAYPLKSKQYGDMEEAFDKLLSDIPITPARIFTDKGKEFILNKHIKYKENGKTITKTVNYFEEKGIEKYWSSTKTIKAALAERYIRVLKSRIYRYLSNNGTLKWFDVLDKIVVALNNTPSRITGMSAMDINFENAQTIWQKVYGKYFERRGENKKPRYLKGDNVRMSNYKEVFDRGFLPNWSDEILEVDSIKRGIPDTYKVKDDKGTEFKGRFYAEDLGKTRKDTETSYRIEKVISKRKTKEGRIQMKVKFIGYPDPEWINETDIVN